MLLSAIIPVFLVILLGFVFAKVETVKADTEQFIHKFVLNLSLPAVLFLAVAQARTEELLNVAFLVTVLGGIAVAYAVAVLWAKCRGIAHPDSSILGMGGSYGTTGFMGIPLLLMAFGDSMGVVAAIATILHNIPVIITVVAGYQMHRSAETSQTTKTNAWRRLVGIIFANPLMLSVLAGACFAFTPLALPEAMLQFCRFFGAAAGPCALFSLGIGLAKISQAEKLSKQHVIDALPIVAIKLLLHPLITFVIGYYIFDMTLDNRYFICAVIMAALPVGVASHVFAKNYRFYSHEIAIACVLSLVLAFFSLSYLLTIF